MKKAIQIALLGSSSVEKTELERLAAVGGFIFAWIPDGTSPVLDDYGAVFVFSDGACRIAADTVAGWIGHPHLRVIGGDTAEEQLAVLRREIEAVLGTEECERKFLVGYPDIKAMEASPFCASSHIVQTYLLSEPSVTERVRMRECGGNTVYTHTVKRRIDRQTSEELEREIGREEYLRLVARADTERTPIEKTRWCILYCGKYFELDIYPFWDDRATVELESTEVNDTEIDFPPYFRVMREVTNDVRYKNARLAAEVPYDEIG